MNRKKRFKYSKNQFWHDDQIIDHPFHDLRRMLLFSILQFVYISCRVVGIDFCFPFTLAIYFFFFTMLCTLAVVMVLLLYTYTLLFSPKSDQNIWSSTFTEFLGMFNKISIRKLYTAMIITANQNNSKDIHTHTNKSIQHKPILIYGIPKKQKRTAKRKKNSHTLAEYVYI